MTNPDIPEPVQITIRHTHTDGTTLTGSAKGDGVYDIVRQPENGGFRWGRGVGIYLRGSRDGDAQVYKINAAVGALRAAGHEVTVDIDNQPRPTTVREAARVERAEERADRLADRAGSAAARGAATYQAGRDKLDRIPFGQPILVGHHSEGRDRRFREGAIGQIDRGMAELGKADHLTDRAGRVEAHQRQRTNARVTMRRVRRLTADLRAARRNGRDTARIEEEIAHWQGMLDQYEASGEFVPWRKTDFIPGDHIQVEGRHWYPVKRANAQTVSVVSPSWPSTVPYDEITGRRRDGVQLDTPHGSPWPAEMARKVARWGELSHLLSLPSSQNSYDDESVTQRRNVGWARRLALGLPTTACDAEVAAFTAPDRDTARALAAGSIDIYDRLQAGEKPTEVAATITPVDCGEPAWRMPTGEPEDRRVDQLQPGDIIAGHWDRTFNGRRLVTSFAGPVEHVIAVQRRYESGDWVTVRLVDGSERHDKTHIWYAAFPGAASNLISSDRECGVDLEG